MLDEMEAGRLQQTWFLSLFSIIVTNKRRDLVVWNDKDKKAMLLELTVSWDENFELAKQRKLKRYEELIEEYEEHKWEIEFYHVVENVVKK